MKTILGLAFLLISAQSYSAPVSKPLLKKEIQLAIEISDKYEVPLQTRGPCAKTTFKVLSRVKGFNPASWTISFGSVSKKLEQSEIQGLIGIFNRLKVPRNQIDSITSETSAFITGSSCGFTPNKWLISFDDLQ